MDICKSGHTYVPDPFNYIVIPYVCFCLNNNHMHCIDAPNIFVLQTKSNCYVKVKTYTYVCTYIGRTHVFLKTLVNLRLYMYLKNFAKCAAYIPSF